MNLSKLAGIELAFDMFALGDRYERGGTEGIKWLMLEGTGVVLPAYRRS